MPDDCRKILTHNVIRIIKNAGFGDLVKTSDPNKVNLTTLMAMITLYQKFEFTLDQVMQILERIKLEIDNTRLVEDDIVTAQGSKRKYRKVLALADFNKQRPDALNHDEENSFKRGEEVSYSIKSHVDDEVNAWNQPQKKLH